MNSYKRLVPGYEAPVYLAWSRRNRSALVRVPMYHPGQERATRMELRCPDPACNPYLTFAVLLQAGLEGIEHRYELPDPMETNLYHLSSDERRRLGIEQLPATLGEAIELTAESELVLRALGEHMFNRYIEIKRQEWDDYRVQVTPWELERATCRCCSPRCGLIQRRAASSVGAGDRRLADEALAHVRGGVAVDRLAALEQRHAVGLAGGEHQVRPVGVADDARAAPGLGLRADDRHLLDRRQVEVGRLQQVPERLRMAAWRAGTAAAARRARDARSAPSPDSSASRSSPNAAAELPDGIGESSRSLRRAASCSWSEAVVKKPPRSGSSKRSIITSASAVASAYQRGSPVASYSEISASSRNAWSSR